LAKKFGPSGPLADGFQIDSGDVLSFLPLLSYLADERDAGRGAAVFHETLAAGFCALAARSAEQLDVCDIALAGGCLLNARLACRLRHRLESHGLRVFEAASLPPNDGGLSYGQAWVAIRANRSELP